VELVWLCNPNNPTGQVWPRGLLAPWIEAHPRTTFVIDEAFLPFLAAEKYHTLVPALDRLPNLVVLRSLTKIFALPGLRLGYLIVPARVSEFFQAHARPAPWSVNSLAQIAALAALDDSAYLGRTHAWLEAERDRFFGQLAGFSTELEPVPAELNFTLLRLKGPGLTSGRLASGLARKGIAVRDASNFVGLDEHYIRVAVRTRRQNQQFVETLASLFAGGG
jgi:threonine-phosphate decarboxylase